MYPLDTAGGGYGSTEPLCPGCYKKPDTNIGVPSGTPITALASGIVSDSSDKGRTSGGLSVTVKLDQAINSNATHMSYNYLGRSIVSPGQRVNAGQIIGYAGSPYGILTAFGLTSDSSWGCCAGFQLNARGDPSVDPRPVLAAIRAGKPLPSGNPNPSPSCSCGVTDIGCCIAGALNLDAIKASIVNFTEEVAVFLIALLLIVIGVMLLAGKQITGFTKSTAEKGAILAV